MGAQSLSVVMGTYNGEAWIAEQLQSIAKQTRLPDELIISDDGSTDRTLEIARSFAATAPFPVHLAKGPSKGHAENFWSASIRCNSDLISWSDQDDVWDPRKLEVSEKSLVSSGAAVASHSATVTDEKLNSLRRRFPNYRSDVVLHRLEGNPWFVMSGFTMLVRREVLDHIAWATRPLSHQSGVAMGPDHAVTLVSFASMKRVLISESLALYRQHSSNLAGAPRALALRESMRIGRDEYRADAQCARDYLTFLARCGCSEPDFESYYEALIDRCERRADIYEAGGFGSRIRRLGAAVLAGVYGSREKGRFRPAALAKDMAEVLRNASDRLDST
jgi:hypothetical protein